MSEAWKPLPPANGGVYEISNLGNLRLVTPGAALFPVTFTPISPLSPVLEAKSYGPLTKPGIRDIPRRKSGVRSLSPAQVRGIRVGLKSNATISSIAQGYGVNPGTVYQIKNGITYKDVV